MPSILLLREDFSEKTRLNFLAFSSVLNAVLDLIFLGTLHFGIVCSAANALGVTTIAAYNVVTRVDEFAFIPDIAYACAAGWTLMLLFEVPYYYRCVQMSSLSRK